LYYGHQERGTDKKKKLVGAVDVNWDKLGQGGSCLVAGSGVSVVESLGFCTYYK
jgi:hypothetical protein